MSLDADLDDVADDELLTVREVASKTRMPINAIYAFVRDGSLTAVMLGPRRIRIRPADLAAFYEAHATGVR